MLDGGATDEGLPYLVMEYIGGRPVVDDCQARELPLRRERLALFEQICAAVQHAHQKLMVHRDIKPANILVTPAGTPKLLDFGIAKLVLSDNDEAAPSDALTRAGARLLTPDYASPEQILGQPVSVATDVYSLGLVLYELLTGERAHRFESYKESEFVGVLSRPRSGRQVRWRGLTRGCGGRSPVILTTSWRWRCGKIRRGATYRWSNLRVISAAIYEGRPVLARKETFFYQARKFVGRHRAPAVAATFALLAYSRASSAPQCRPAAPTRMRLGRSGAFQQVRKLANTVVFDIYDGMEDIPGTAKLRASVVATALDISTAWRRMPTRTWHYNGNSPPPTGALATCKAIRPAADLARDAGGAGQL